MQPWLLGAPVSTQAASQPKLALVTGASRGIGLAVATQLAEQGFYVIGTATSQEGAKKLSPSLGAAYAGYVLDLADSHAIAQLVEHIEAEHGGVQVLVNNAGITRDNLAVRMRDEDWDQVLSVDLSGPFRLARACLRGMMRRRWGRIINLSSVVGAMGNPGQANYAAAKAGLVGLSRALAREVGSRNITVNVVAPGFIDTDMTRSLPQAQRDALVAQTPLGRLGTTADVAATVAFLASDAAAFITGQTVHVNGGLYMG